MKLSFDELLELLIRALRTNGVSERNALHVARAIAWAERDESHGHGIFRLRGYIDSLKSGWIDGKAEAVVDASLPGLVKIDAKNGFAQPALASGRQALTEKARTNGIALMTIRNSHHFAALWCDVEPFADEGFVAFAFVNSRSRLAPWMGEKKLFGTNPMAFACPRADGPPIVWDQASSVVANADVLMAARDKRAVPLGWGLDKHGQPTSDPSAILDGGAQLPFGAHKGSMIALMVEILAAALTGGRFGMEDASGVYPGATTSNAGETIILIDPVASAGDAFCSRVTELCDALVSNGAARLPGARRHTARARSQSEGVVVSAEAYELVKKLAETA